MRKLYLTAVIFLVGATSIGCSNQKLIAQKDLEIRERDQTISELQTEIDRLSAERERADELNADLEAALSSLEEKNKLSLSGDANRAMITLPNAVTFASASATLSDEGMAIIDQVWTVLSKYPDRKIMVEGHTDNLPIAPEFQRHYATNWELSTARALAVVHHVRDKFKTDPERLAAVGCGEYQPIATNDDEAGRSKNRRVVVVVVKPTATMVSGK